MNRYNELPDGYSSWKEYLRQDIICINRHPEQYAKYMKMYAEHMEALYDNIPPWNDYALLVKYRLPFRVVREKPQYGIYGFRIYDKQTGRKKLVRFDDFKEYGLDKIKGTCKYTTAWPYDSNKAELQRIIDESSRQFWDEARHIMGKLSEYRPQTFINTEDNKERHRYYLRSKQWCDIAARIRSRDGFHCRQCNKFDRHLHVHHKTYERWGEESMDDLIAVCEKCHAWIHGKIYGQMEVYS